MTYHYVCRRVSTMARFVRDEEVAGSNPATPTIYKTFKASNLQLSCCWLFLFEFTIRQRICAPGVH